MYVRKGEVVWEKKMSGRWNLGAGCRVRFAVLNRKVRMKRTEKSIPEKKNVGWWGGSWSCGCGP